MDFAVFVNFVSFVLACRDAIGIRDGGQHEYQTAGLKAGRYKRSC